jgi:hypothetical protein
MKISPSKLNAFTLFKLPSAYFCGVRAKVLNNDQCITTVKHRWFNQNPFKSMFWAVQGMAAELATGALMIMKIKESGKKVSMLVTTNNASFCKKATGRIKFECNDGKKVDKALEDAIKTGEGQTIWMQAIGTNKVVLVLSYFNF